MCASCRFLRVITVKVKGPVFDVMRSHQDIGGFHNTLLDHWNIWRWIAYESIRASFVGNHLIIQTKFYHHYVIILYIFEKLKACNGLCSCPYAPSRSPLKVRLCHIEILTCRCSSIISGQAHVNSFQPKVTLVSICAPETRTYLR